MLANCQNQNLVVETLFLGLVKFVPWSREISQNLLFKFHESGALVDNGHGAGVRRATMDACVIA